MAPQTKRNCHRQTVEGCQTNAADLPQSDVPDHPPDNTEKPTVPTMTLQMTIREKPQGTGAHDRNRRKSLPPLIGTGLNSHCKQNKATIWIYRRPKQNTLTQHLFHPCQYPNLVLFFTTISFSIP